MNKTVSAININKFSLYSNSKHLLSDISFNIYENQITAIIGSSYSGKSAFLKSLNRLIELEANIKTEGTIEFFGQNIYGRRINLSRLRRQVSSIFQTPNIFPVSTYENVAYGIKLTGWYPKYELDRIVELAIKRAGLWDDVRHRLYKSALDLPILQQQQLCIARALAVKPKVLLMDEPCGSLGSAASLKIEEIIQSLRGQMTIVIATQDTQFASRISDFTAFFSSDEKGTSQMLEFGTTVQIFTKPSNSRTSDYVCGRYN
jgi:phosphate transport system ATP-binding protein